uniref:Sushi domain-containing protein n=1 Tax=Eptatretus burgeri TaxID=7764 RepID=A0A8C4R3E5_EPTBU
MEMQGTNPAECYEGQIQLPECRSVCCNVSANELRERNLVVEKIRRKNMRKPRILRRQQSHYKFPLGTKVYFLCEEDHSSDMPLHIVCRDDNFNLPRCTPDFCDLEKSDFDKNNLVVPESYKKLHSSWTFYYFRFPRDKPVTLKCKDYMSSAHLTVTCKDGVVKLPKCHAVCSIPNIPGNVEFSVLNTTINELGITFPSTLMFSCKFDFNTLYGSNHSECMENGIWNYKPPSCLSKTCSPQPSWNDTDELIHPNETFHQAMCLVTSKQLLDRKLKEPSSFRNLWREKDRAFFLPSEASYTFSCPSCTEIRGTNPTECNDGVIDLPNCQAVCCSIQELQLAKGRLKVPQEFQITGSAYTVPLDTEVTFHCKEDHMLYGPTQRTCQDGHLSVPVCTQAVCKVTEDELAARFTFIHHRFNMFKKIKGYYPKTYYYKIPTNHYVEMKCEDGKKPLKRSMWAYCSTGHMYLPSCGTDSDLTCMISEKSLKNKNLRIPRIYQHVDIGGYYHQKVPEGETVSFHCSSGSTPDRERTCEGGVIDLPTCQIDCKSWLINHGGIRSWISKTSEIIVSCPARHLTYAHTIRCLNTGPEAEIQCCPQDPKITEGNLEVIRPVYRRCQLIIQARATCNIGTRLVGSEIITCQGSRWPTETLSCQPDGIKNNQMLQWNISLPKDADMQEDYGRKLVFRANHLREAQITWLGSALPKSTFLCYTGKIYWRLKVLMETTFIERDGRDNEDCVELSMESKKLELHLLFHEFSFGLITQMN